jgi:hypothetical protein
MLNILQIVLLSDVIPLYQYMDNNINPMLTTIPTLLTELQTEIQLKCTDLTQADVELISTELLATDYIQMLINYKQNNNIKNNIDEDLKMSTEIASRLIKFVKLKADKAFLLDIFNNRKSDLSLPEAPKIAKSTEVSKV